MFVLVSYDVSTVDKAGRTRLRRVAKMCENYGQRVQLSLFECIVDPAQWAAFRRKLIDIIVAEEDSLRFYFLGSNWRGRVEHVGAKPGIDQEGPLVV
ncbi:MAG: CRISPR-associated endonuclease Cas2 [Syntrophobacteraceae bacterium]